jgi:hypothetical protein
MFKAKHFAAAAKSGQAFASIGMLALQVRVAKCFASKREAL